MVVIWRVSWFVFSASPLPANPRPHANFRKQKRHQNIGPTATGLGASDRARSVDIFSWLEIAVRVEQVGFTGEALSL